MMSWYAVYTRPHDETRALEHLSRQGYSAYLPRYRTQISHARRHQRTSASRSSARARNGELIQH